MRWNDDKPKQSKAEMTMQIINNCKFTGISTQIINTGMKVESLCKELKEKEEIKEDKTHEQ